MADRMDVMLVVVMVAKWVESSVGAKVAKKDVSKVSTLVVRSVDKMAVCLVDTTAAKWDDYWAVGLVASLVGLTAVDWVVSSDVPMAVWKAVRSVVHWVGEWVGEWVATKVVWTVDKTAAQWEDHLAVCLAARMVGLMAARKAVRSAVRWA